MPVRHFSIPALLLTAALAPTAPADQPTDDQLKFFEAKIRPVLVDQCYSCHTVDTKKGPRGGLTVDTRDGLRTGGDTGPAVVPGNARKSLLVHALKGTNDAAQMPPKEKLPADVIADFEKWVAMGAPDPRDGTAVTPAKGIDIEAGKQHWAFHPVKAVPPPKGTVWATTEVDRFVEAKRTEAGLTAVAEADKRTLLRRVYFDLVGLPPAPADVDAFLADSSPVAFEKVVDKLLASPQFGERWGRHWLDVARYAESSGKEQNIIYPHAWRYRDYVIAAFNADKPIDQFFREQLAGDLLPAKDDTDRANKLIATGYLAVGPKSHNERNRKQFELDVADEQIDAFSQGMLGLTVACARCHDHKFDPIPTRDYYAIAGIFTSTETKVGTPGVLGGRGSSPAVTLPAGAKVPVGPAFSSGELDRLTRQLEELKKQRADAIEESRKSREVPVRLVFITSRINVLENQIQQYDVDGDHKKIAMGVEDRFFPRDMPVYIRGELDKTGEVVPRGFVQVLSNGRQPKLGRKESGRRELADWVASADNPLTARVYVNRVWQHLFGAGLVRSADNFGTTGQKPTHPELLDHLASKFMANPGSDVGGMGWSTKTLIRTLVLTRTYRMSSDHHPANAQLDPENRYLWRMSKRRLDAEAIRDAMLAVSGSLDPTPADGSPVAKQAGPAQAFGRFGGLTAMESNKRSVYLPIVRDNVPEALELFDFAEPSLVTGSRDDTSVPSQGLYLLNNPKVMQWADATVAQLRKYSSDTDRLNAAFRLVLSRSPTRTEEAAAAEFVRRYKQTEGRGFRRGPATEQAAWAALVQGLFATAEFRYVD